VRVHGPGLLVLGPAPHPRLAGTGRAVFLQEAIPISVTASNLTLGPGTLFHGLETAADPADLNTDPAAPDFTDVGGTSDGVTLSIEQEYTELTVDQIVDRVGSRLTSRTMTIATNLAEPTLENLSLVLNGGGTVTPGAGSKTFEPSNDTSATQPTYCKLVFDGIAPGGGRRRVIGRRMLSTESVEFAYSKDEQTVFSVTFTGHFVSASVPPFAVIDES
jgi:hypothetical protein